VRAICPGAHTAAERITLYLASMSEGERAGPQAHQGGELDERGQRASAAQEEREKQPSELERYGPLELERTRKDDARMLIYYSAVERSS
jgi:hypothetical protein